MNLIMNKINMEITCPSCWAKHTIQPGMLSVVCEYCNAIIKIERKQVVETWEKSLILPFPTTFEAWKYFYVIKDNNSNDKLFSKNVSYISDKELYERKFKDFLMKIYVFWQIRYTNDGGFWDDWFVKIIESKQHIDKNKDFVIKEDEWLINMQYITDIKKSKNHEIFSKSAWLSYNWYFIQEIWTASIEWFKWDFPFYISNQNDSKYVILVSENKTMEYKTIWDNLIISKNI